MCASFTPLIFTLHACPSALPAFSPFLTSPLLFIILTLPPSHSLHSSHLHSLLLSYPPLILHSCPSILPVSSLLSFTLLTLPPPRSLHFPHLSSLISSPPLSSPLLSLHSTCFLTPSVPHPFPFSFRSAPSVRVTAMLIPTLC